MKTLKKNKKLTKLVSLIILGIIVIGLLIVLYINPVYQNNNKLLLNNIESLLDKEEVTLEELIPFDFDSIYLFEPYSYKKDMESQMGIRSRFIKDNYTDNLGTELIVVKNKKVISSVFIKLEKCGFIIEGLVYSNKLDKNSDISFKLTKSDLGVFIRQKLNYYNDSFYDILYTVPGEWWKEDWEEEGYFYYVNEDSTDHVIIRKEELLDKNKFIKYAKKDLKSVEFKEIININDFEGYHLVGKKDNTMSHYISLNIKNESYVFIVNGKEDTIDNLYNELDKVLRSINIYNEG